MAEITCSFVIHEILSGLEISIQPRKIDDASKLTYL